MSGRATSPVLGIVLLLVITAVIAGAVGGVALDTSLPDPSPRAVVELEADADANRLSFVHRGGDPLDAAELTLRVRVDGTPLDAQPPIPFFAAEGFRAGPTGPFNAASDDRWTAGERASFRIAGTNEPTLAAGAAVAVTLSVDDRVVAEVEATA